MGSVGEASTAEAALAKDDPDGHHDHDIETSTTSACTEKRAAKRKPGNVRPPRVQTACERCRIKRVRCDGELPSCARCLSLDLPCQYPRRRRPRGRSDYVRVLASQTSSSLPQVTEHSTQDLLGDRFRPEAHRNKDSQPLALPPDAWSLIDTYFAYTQSWLPILDRANVYRTAHFCSASGVEDAANCPGPGATVALWAALALASSQISMPPRDRNHIYRVARGLVSDDVETCGLGHAQALLLLSLVKFNAGFCATASLLVGQAIQIAYNIGLHQANRPSDGDAASHAPHPKGKHVLLGCFILDTLYSARLGRPPQLRKDFVGELERLDEDVLEEWDVWDVPPHLNYAVSRQPLRLNSTFKELGKIHVLLNDLLCSGMEKEHAPGQYSLFFDRLVKLSRELPSPCQLNMSLEESKLIANIHQLQVYNLHSALAAAAMLLQLYPYRAESADTLATNLGTGPTHAHHILGLLRRYSTTFGLSYVPPHLDFAVALATRLSERPTAGTDCDWSAERTVRIRLEGYAARIRYQRLQLDAVDTASLASPASLTTATTEAASSPATSLDGASHHTPALCFSTPSSSICTGPIVEADVVAMDLVGKGVPCPDELKNCAQSLDVGSVSAAYGPRESETPFQFIDWPNELLAFSL
ncbi:hypothetical protein BU16DRAFT_612304 [Lophium mytilinum]|uniref:Zn(2)-C6 fungal-type domain-containing protein n=1 Tax=Lophium mytilinum TaxID=390894 RepID=A0A6A6RCS4_9PEZI|nr:hypothetical protein BU16DRAFT_612304 [Lophium mytilinum]